MFTYAGLRLLFILLLTAGVLSCEVESTDVGTDSGSKAVIEPTITPPTPINSKRVICDPFETNSPQSRDNGLFGNIFFLDRHHHHHHDNHHKNMSSKGNGNNNGHHDNHNNDDDDDDDENNNGHHHHKSKSV